MKRKYQILLSIIALIIVIIVVNYQSPSNEEIHKSAFETARMTKYYGIVTKKYYLKNRPSYPSISIQNNVGAQQVMFIYDKSGLYDYLRVGDSIYKEYGYNDVLIIRDSIQKKFTLDYGI